MSILNNDPRNNPAKPMCGCELNTPLAQRYYHHTAKREVSRAHGLTEYQKERAVWRRFHLQSNH